MHRPTYTLSFALAFFLTTACGDGDGDGSGESIRALCQKGCAIEAGLACPNDTPSTCLSECESADDPTNECQSEAQAALECIVNRPASDWECDTEAGEATVKDGVCAEQINPLLVCLFGNGGDGTCPYEDDDECDDPTGTGVCPEGTDLADCAG